VIGKSANLQFQALYGDNEAFERIVGIRVHG
jgi:hypothetical protein